LIHFAILIFAAALPVLGFESILKVEVLEGDGAVYNLRSRSFAVPRLRVTEGDAGRPVDGAAVTFRLPDSGPGAAFAEGRIAMVTTDAKGEASVPAMKLNSQLGNWEIRVAATHAGQTARATILQINAAPVEAISLAGQRSRSLYWVAAIAAGAATAATIGLVGGGSSPARSGGVSGPGTAAVAVTPPPLSISAGGGSVSAP
jgi:hypothetical protein